MYNSLLKIHTKIEVHTNNRYALWDSDNWSIHYNYSRRPIYSWHPIKNCLPSFRVHNDTYFFLHML